MGGVLTDVPALKSWWQLSYQVPGILGTAHVLVDGKGHQECRVSSITVSAWRHLPVMLRELQWCSSRLQCHQEHSPSVWLWTWPLLSKDRYFYFLTFFRCVYDLLKVNLLLKPFDTLHLCRIWLRLGTVLVQRLLEHNELLINETGWSYSRCYLRSWKGGCLQERTCDLFACREDVLVWVLLDISHYLRAWMSWFQLG